MTRLRAIARHAAPWAEDVAGLVSLALLCALAPVALLLLEGKL